MTAMLTTAAMKTEEDVSRVSLDLLSRVKEKRQLTRILAT